MEEEEGPQNGQQSADSQGDRSNHSNYRPLALVSCLSKVFESIVNKKILKHLSFHNLISNHQYGFHQGRSTGDLASPG